MTSIATIVLALAVVHQAGASPGRLLDERDLRLESVRKTLADASVPLEQRASVALEEAARLDGAAQAAGSGDDRRRLARLAVELLDGFNAAHPDHSLATALALQSAVYAWADGRRELDAWRGRTDDEAGKGRAIARLDDAVARLDRVEPQLSGSDPLVAQNGRFRLAQALSDRAWLDPSLAGAATDRLRRALAALEPVPTEPSLAGFARFLRAEIRARLGDLDRAEAELDAAARLKYPPAAESLANLRTEILVGQRRFRDALKALDGSGLDPVARASMSIQIRLARRRAAASTAERDESEREAFAEAATIRDAARPEARRAREQLARDVDKPTAGSDPWAYDLLADGALGLGHPDRAARLAALGADLARTRGDRPESARLRLKAGAILFQAGDYPGAIATLGKVWADRQSGPSRPKAGLLLAIARGRALSGEDPPADRESYEAALLALVAEYPDDPGSAEARWLLGQLRRDEGRTAEAVALWKAIPPAQPRWIAARLAVARTFQRELDELRIAEDPRPIDAKYREATAFLRASVRASPAQAIDLDLATARLYLTPGVGDPDLARSIADRLPHEAGSAAQHATARALGLVALVARQQYNEAERELRKGPDLTSTEGWLAAARLIDESATVTGSEVHRARSGRLLKLLVDGLARQLPGWPAPARTEMKLRSIRASILAGDPESARRDIREASEWDLDPFDADLLRDLADAFLRLEAYGVAVDVDRLRARKLRPGTPPWFDARYQLALALYRGRKPREAARLIDATAILHPDLGGHGLKLRFERLRQKIEGE